MHNETSHEHLLSEQLLLLECVVVFVQLDHYLVKHYVSDALHHLSLLYPESLKIFQHLFFLHADNVPFGHLEHPKLQ